MTQDSPFDFFGVNLVSSSGNPTVQIVLRAQDLYVQGFYVPDRSTYYHFNDAAFTAYPGTSTNPVTDVTLPFAGSYASMMQSPRGPASSRSLTESPMTFHIKRCLAGTSSPPTMWVSCRTGRAWKCQR